MMQSVHNRYNHIVYTEKSANSCISSKKSNEMKPQKNEKKGEYDTFEISKDSLKTLQNQEEAKGNTISQEISKTENTSQFGVEEKKNDSIVKETTQEKSENLEEEMIESSSCGGSVGINAGKLARKLSAAKTKEQLQAIIAEIRQDLKECEAGEAQGMIVDEASVQAAQNLLNQARQRMGSVADREATPEEEMAFSLAGLL